MMAFADDPGSQEAFMICVHVRVRSDVTALPLLYGLSPAAKPCPIVLLGTCPRLPNLLAADMPTARVNDRNARHV